MTDTGTNEDWPLTRRLIPAFLGRLFLVVYAKLHDYLFHVRFTDIDYMVFTDAAKNVYQGGSPFSRSTYRYSPFLAWLLVPNMWFFEFGKLVFCLVDILVGWLIFECGRSNNGNKNLQLLSALSIFWLFNPFTAIISSRGNADALVCGAVMGVLYLLQKRNWIAASLVHGLLAIHLKLYPVIYLPSVFLHLAQATTDLTFSEWFKRCITNLKGYLYCMLSILGFLLLLGVGFVLYGELFMEEYLLYHFHRTDVRHNFSPYFLPLYLAYGDSYWTRLIGFGAFIPQLLCILFFAIKYNNDLPFCWFLTTFSFVSLNKVCTSQYFIWYIVFLPLISSRITLCSTKTFWLIALWFVAQGLWLFPAYLLEFKGISTFEFIWLASLLFLGVNFYIIRQLVLHYIAQGSRKKIN